MKGPGAIERAFTLCVDDAPVAVFVAKNYPEARELVHEHWLQDELATKTLRDRPLWIADATLSVRSADEIETKAYHDGKAVPENEDGLALVYLIPIDGP
jgi:hypothetical protein